MGEISWQKRLAIVLSAIWLALIGAFSRSESDSLTSFLILGVLPIAFCWGIAWVWSGFRRQRPTAPPAVTELRLRLSKNAVFVPNSLSDFLARPYCPIMAIFDGFWAPMWRPKKWASPLGQFGRPS